MINIHEQSEYQIFVKLQRELKHLLMKEKWFLFSASGCITGKKFTVEILAEGWENRDEQLLMECYIERLENTRQLHKHIS